VKIHPNLQSHLDAFQLANPKEMAQTALASVYEVERTNGTHAALKCWHNPLSEQSGVDYLADLNGQGAVRIMDRREGAIVMELLEGLSLGSLVRAGDDKQALKFWRTSRNHFNRTPTRIRLSLNRLNGGFALCSKQDIHPIEIRTSAIM